MNRDPIIDVRAGRLAAESGKPPTANPHPPATSAARFWARGYLRAVRDSGCLR